jgi:hypothetical protein
LGITIHGTFILGLPGETRATIEETIRFAQEINPHTIQVSLAAPCASLMVGAPAAADAVRRARRMPTLRVGLHLVLANGPSVLPNRAIPDPVGSWTPHASFRASGG